MRALALEKKQQVVVTAHRPTAWQRRDDSSTCEPAPTPPGRNVAALAILRAMFRFLKRLLKWAVIIAAVAAVVRWLKNKREGDDAEQDPGSIEPWPPLDTSDIPSGEGTEETATA